MSKASEILSSPDYINANAETKRAIFDKHIASDASYTSADPATQQAILGRFGLGTVVDAPVVSAPPQKRGMFDMLSAPFEMGASLASKPRAEQVAFFAPTIEALGTAGGAIVGTGAGPVGTLVGAGAGYAGAKEFTRLLAGDKPPETLPQAAGRQAKTVLEGIAMEGMGRYTVAPAIRGLAKGAGWLTDLWTGKLVQVRGGKIMREIAGADLGAAKTLAAQADPSLTAAQATAGANSNMLAAMGQRAARVDPTNFFSRTAAGQEAARAADLARVTPDLAKSIAARTTGASPFYTQSDKTTIMLKQPMMDIFERMPKGTMAKAADIARMENRPFLMGDYIPAHQVPSKILNAAGQPTMISIPAQYPKMTGESLHYIKRGLSDISNAPASAQGLTRDAQIAARSVLGDYVKLLEQEIPAYGLARQTFTQLSKPVNQAELLKAMGDTLAKPTGGERIAPFLGALGQGESALIRRANQQPRFGGISDILTPKQMGVVDDIAAQLKRDYALDQAAVKGAGGLSRLLGESQTSGTLPPAFSALTRTANFIIRILEGSVNAKSLVALENGMRSGKDFLKLVNTLPAAEQSAVLKVLGQTQRAAGGGLAGLGLADAANALVTRHQNQNAMNE